EIESPMAIGFFHPAVVIPEPMQDRLSGDEMDAILLHEAAHLARYDDWTNLAGRLLQATFGWHPIVLFVLRQIEREREIACDEWVVTRTGAAIAYAEGLVRILEMQLKPVHSTLASGIFIQRSRLRARIELLVQKGRKFSATAGRKTIVVAVFTLAGFAMVAAFAPRWIVFAQRLEFEVASVRRNTNNGPLVATPTISGN